MIDIKERLRNMGLTVCKEAADRIAELEAMVAANREDAWLPIETAPKDGSVFIAYRPLAYKSNDSDVRLVHGRDFNNGCWESTIPEGMDNSNFTDGYCKPTHWMKIPKPPASTQEAG